MLVDDVNFKFFVLFRYSYLIELLPGALLANSDIDVLSGTW